MQPRFVLRPRRLEPNREAIVVLSLILTIMITDFLYDGFKFALFAGSETFPRFAGGLGWTLGGFAAFVLGAASKETAAMLPFLLLAAGAFAG